MIFLLLLIIFLAFAYGIYMFAIAFLNLPTQKAKKVALQFSKNGKETKSFESYIIDIATHVERYIKVDDYQQKKLGAQLKSAGINMTPELFKATVFTKTILILTLIIPAILIMPLLAVAVVFFALITFFKENAKLEESLKNKKELIERELPRFASNLKESLKSSRDVLTILEKYKNNAGAALKKELDITIADMRTGNYEAALLRFEGRITSAPLSDIVRGLIGVLRGDDNVTYFAMLSHDLDSVELERLEAEATKQPDKIKKYIFLVFLMLIIMYFLILGVYAFESIVESGGML